MKEEVILEIDALTVEIGMAGAIEKADEQNLDWDSIEEVKE
jgi:hypothetical protein